MLQIYWLGKRKINNKTFNKRERLNTNLMLEVKAGPTARERECRRGSKSQIWRFYA